MTKKLVPYQVEIIVILNSLLKNLKDLFFRGPAQHLLQRITTHKKLITQLLLNLANRNVPRLCLNRKKQNQTTLMVIKIKWLQLDNLLLLGADVNLKLY